MIKAVIWDLDQTLFDGVFLETPDQRPAGNAERIALLGELAGRGILQAIASRNPPAAADYAAELTGQQFAAVRCGWGAKSIAIAELAAELDLEPTEVAFVDDDPMERAEVLAKLPGVLVLAPEELTDAAAWPAFSPR